ncbi:HEPN domain-containing protein [Lutibacter sp. TH_r2]|uniref:HEPN domain-containing protein n=1 Tax=Lutibacter sp. TH_r2 TaxID=3082083 RepID=UPI0029548C82|nr:HEPN domain-containing protein [Lutibacter sp. TH_r2]MDV7187306.1 HEPN domain-containing protein [Lutibacter sp. TH_r2]
METRAQAFFKKANEKLVEAKEELFKPSEDLVSYSVCKNAQISIENYLKGFLIKNNVNVTIEDTIESLYNKCIEVDKDFKKIDMKAVSCRGHKMDSRYCTDVETISACFDTADNIDTYLKKIKAI